MDKGKSEALAGPEVWRQWNRALAEKLGAGGQDLAAQAQVLAQAAAAARERGDRLALWAALNALTKISLGLQQVAQAREPALEALALAEDLYGPDSGQAGTVLSDLIFIEAHEGREPQALILARRLEAILREQACADLDQAFSYNLTSLATFHAMRKDDDLVERLLWGIIRQAELRPDGDPDLLLFVHDNLANFCAARGDSLKAQEVRQRALKIMEQAGYPQSRPPTPGKPGKPSLH